MSKYKYNGDLPLTFDYEGKEKILLPGQTYELENNTYIDGLIGRGVLTVPEPKKENTNG